MLFLLSFVLSFEGFPNVLGHRVGLRFTDFDLEAKEDCSFDYVLLTDGPDPELGHVIGRFCGKVNTRSFEPQTSLSNVMTVQFKSDQTVTHRGFKVRKTKLFGFKKLNFYLNFI